jgi:DNA-directed RNA polymerase specialized sigma24 family protein
VIERTASTRGGGGRDALPEHFGAHRSRVRGVAYRMLGSVAEAEDAVQEAWLRWSRSDPGRIDDVRAWLTTVVARICLNVLRSRATHRETSLDVPDPAMSPVAGVDPEQDALLADSVGLAMLIVLDSLSVAVMEVSGRRWIRARWGEVNWVRNLRTTGRAPVTVRRRSEDIVRRS